MSAHATQDEETWMSAIAIGVGLIVLGGAVLALSQAMHAFVHTTHGLDHAIYIGGMVACALLVIYGAIAILSGLVNSAFGSDGHDDHDDHGHDDHAHHGSWSPIIMAFGAMLFLMGFIQWNQSGAIGILGAGILILFAGIANWWREDFGNDGKNEPMSYGEPFGGIEIRKVGLWVFLMSEVMIFGSFFSSYLRLRTGWTTHWDVDCDPFGGGGAVCPDGYVVVASELINESFWTLLPGAINTFALILSSFTVVTALRHAQMVDWQKPKNKLVAWWMPDQRRAIRNNLMMTLALGSLFLVLKLIEWDHMMNGAHPFTIDTLAGSVFYITTGAHGFHVFVGLIILLFFTFKAQKGGWTADNAQSIEYFGLYWHFVDLAWVAIFPAFYLY